MSTDKLFLLHDLCIHYQLEPPFVKKLSDFGLIKVTVIDELKYLSPEGVVQLEKIIRIHTELQVNVEGIDVVMNLLDQIADLKAQVTELKEKLMFHSDREL